MLLAFEVHWGARMSWKMLYQINYKRVYRLCVEKRVDTFHLRGLGLWLDIWKLKVSQKNKQSYLANVLWLFKFPCFLNSILHWRICLDEILTRISKLLRLNDLLIWQHGKVVAVWKQGHCHQSLGSCNFLSNFLWESSCFISRFTSTISKHASWSPSIQFYYT